MRVIGRLVRCMTPPLQVVVGQIVTLHGEHVEAHRGLHTKVPVNVEMVPRGKRRNYSAEPPMIKPSAKEEYSVPFYMELS